MSMSLANLLGKTEAEISAVVNKLEAMCGYPSEDIRLVSEIRAKTLSKILDLGLDPSDTTSQELSTALTHKLSRDMSLFSKALGADNIHDSDNFNRLLVRLLNSVDSSSWALKKNTAKDLLADKPPKKVMKYLGYRSVRSMLKREDVVELYAAASLLESGKWQESFWKMHTRLKPSDFEDRPAEFIGMPSVRWDSLGGRAGLVTCLLPLGAAVVWPSPTRLTRPQLSTAVLLFEALELIKIYNCSLRLEQVNSSFGQKVVDLMKPQLHSPVLINGVPIGWDVLHQHYGTQHPANLPLLFDPHLGPPDMHTKTIGQRLSALHPVFSWWSDTHAAVHSEKDRHTSFNISDVTAGNLGGPVSTQALRRSIWNELILKYLKHSGVEQYVSSQLDNRPQEKETIKISALNNRKSPLAMIQSEFA